MDDTRRLLSRVQITNLTYPISSYLISSQLVRSDLIYSRFHCSDWSRLLETRSNQTSWDEMRRGDARFVYSGALARRARLVLAPAVVQNQITILCSRGVSSIPSIFHFFPCHLLCSCYLVTRFHFRPTLWHWNHSSGYGDIAVFLFCKMAAGRHVGFLNSGNLYS